MTRCFLISAIAILGILSATAQTPKTLYDLSDEMGIDQFDVLGISDNAVTLLFPDEWHQWKFTCAANCSGMVAFKFLGENEFSGFYPAGETPKTFGYHMITRGPGKGTTWQMKFVCPGSACPVLHYARMDHEVPSNVAPIANAANQQPVIQPVPQTTPPQTDSSIIPYVIIVSVVILIIVLWRGFRTPKEPEPLPLVTFDDLTTYTTRTSNGIPRSVSVHIQFKAINKPDLLPVNVAIQRAINECFLHDDSPDYTVLDEAISTVLSNHNIDYYSVMTADIK
jgi:hypothetical protein